LFASTLWSTANPIQADGRIMVMKKTCHLARKARRIVFSSLLIGCLLFMSASTQAAAATPEQPSSSELRDGQHDFDFNIGVWHTHVRRIVDPFSPASSSFELDGTVTVRKVWDGKAQLEEIEADGPKGHWEGLTLFLYNSEAKEWSQNYVNSNSGVLEPPLIGSFKNGRGELINQDTFQNKTVLVKGVWSEIKPESHHFDEYFSRDGGQTWLPAFIAVLTRVQTTSASSALDPGTNAAMSVDPKDPQHAFDWDIGTWDIHMMRLAHPLTGSANWNPMDGKTANSKIWGGRANIAEVKASGPTGELELLALRLYNPDTQEWTTSFATSKVGILNPPTGRPIVGTVENGRLTFYDQEPYNDRTILVRFRIGPVSADSAESEQAFSDDGGKTWETNWINKYTRVQK
jgi:hypothetical protein